MATLTIGQLAAAFDPSRLQLFLLPTEQCNFRCTYCYEDFSIGRMAPAIVQGVKALLTTRASDLRELNINWFGGEPLLAKPIIYEISEHAFRLCQERSITYTASVTTNGYLLDLQTVAHLGTLGVSAYQVSLDGPELSHNTTRLRADRGATFSTIWSNLAALAASELDFRVILRVHYSPANYDSLPDLVDDINRIFGRDERFTVFFKAIERLGGANDHSLATFERESKEAAKEALLSKLADPASAAVLAEPGTPYICYASQPNSMVIRATGDIAKCTVALYDEKNRVGTLSENGDVVIDQDKFRWWIRGFESLAHRELSCPWGAAQEKLLRLI